LKEAQSLARPRIQSERDGASEINEETSAMVHVRLSSHDVHQEDVEEKGSRRTGQGKGPYVGLASYIKVQS